MAEQKETKNPVQSAERIFQVMEMQIGRAHV